MKITFIGAGNMGPGIGTRAVADGGLRPIDAGPLNRVQQLDQLGFLHIAIEQPNELDHASAIKLHP